MKCTRIIGLDLALLVTLLFAVVCAYDKLGTPITTIPINIITDNPTIRFKVTNVHNFTSVKANIEGWCINQQYKQ